MIILRNISRIRRIIVLRKTKIRLRRRKIKLDSSSKAQIKKRIGNSIADGENEIRGAGCKVKLHLCKSKKNCTASCRLSAFKCFIIKLSLK